MSHPPQHFQSIIIEHVNPEINGGRYPIKREVGDRLEVSVDIFKEGHDLIGAVLRHKKTSEADWQETPLQHINNDRWAGSIELTENTRYLYTIGAFVRTFASWREELEKKQGVQDDLSSELLEGQALLQAAVAYCKDPTKGTLQKWLTKWTTQQGQEAIIAIALNEELSTLMDRHEERHAWAVYPRELEVIVDRVRARYGAWYEIFPRSQGTQPGKGTTFRECEARLPYIRDMGFDVLYLTPIHPIGTTNRKGPNNSLKAGPNDPGSPYAIGSTHGGYDAIEPSLGTLDDFDHFEKAVRAHGMELALDFAINASPDHPYVKSHPEWFKQRPDGTIKYAENPPKKYEDIYALDFYCQDWRAIWEELKRVILFWVSHGVKIFRVDNPHTKPVPFWEWLIQEIQAVHPDVIFLAEAFTRPKMMRVLAKAGYTQSYTYFTWRNFKQEMTEYLVELTQSEMKEYFRPNFFTCTPDILPEILQQGGPPAFKFRVVLAATLSPTYGIYSSYELCENRALPGKEEYLDSEKYEIKAWDWDRPGNIRDYITRLNQIRKDNPALHDFENLRFYQADNDHIIFYGKSTIDKSNILLIAVNMNPYQTQEAVLHIPIEEFEISHNDTYQLHELLWGTYHLVKGSFYTIRLDPQENPAVIFAVRRWSRKEQDFDYFL
ncbi:alpha-1,4-glucan--maltose-1-phosphate maltosyltransferase [Candidatus Nitronereus thalassa]|uniref:Alpha-1,4-glucan:maltose-1-phosphate maltosyltransferase n=1 Tax=Candidatus Nitronereus thalassa TaxID=3020898 RepID=A0ABU3K5R0_9BACT|nr:alpha-1,4-glucan--maltose-1-phosphate maltosyltransferase [Candidatus Nitronereus thalassa]MDT7041706.1 alpha-1,4-glucan--maltose-1-phosphate maltosyltransferase [Candidatus Nitronereus thalassa]